jgi:hypothetical protein
LKARLNKAESLVFRLGTPEFIKKRGTSRRPTKEQEEGSDRTSSSEDGEDEDSSEDEDDDEQERSSSSSSEDERGGAESQQSADQNMEASIDLGISPTEPAEANQRTGTLLPATRPSFSEALDSSQGHLSRDVTMDGSTGTEVTPAHRKLITLSSLSNKKDDSVNKRTRSSAAHSNDQEQPANKVSTERSMGKRSSAF